jgi:hypothetical protein
MIDVWSTNLGEAGISAAVPPYGFAKTSFD